MVGSKRKPLTAVVDDRRPYYLSDKNTKKNVDDNRNLIVMEDGIIVRALPKWQVPKEAIRDGRQMILSFIRYRTVNGGNVSS